MVCTQHDVTIQPPVGRCRNGVDAVLCPSAIVDRHYLLHRMMCSQKQEAAEQYDSAVVRFPRRKACDYLRSPDNDIDNDDDTTRKVEFHHRCGFDANADIALSNVQKLTLFEIVEWIQRFDGRAKCTRRQYDHEVFCGCSGSNRRRQCLTSIAFQSAAIRIVIANRKLAEWARDDSMRIAICPHFFVDAF